MKKFTLLLSIFLIILLVSIITLVESRKKKKRKAPEAKPLDPKLKRPERIRAELYCDACQALVKESVKLLFGKRSEADVMTVMENVCDPERYYTYCKFIK